MAKYNSSTYDRELEEELLKSRYGLLMQQRDEAIANNNATGVYADWNGGSVSGQDMWNAIQDSMKYGYDIQLDPRNGNGTRGAISDLLLDAGEKANADAIAGNGSYDQNRQSYLDQIGWTDYQSVFKNLQETGKTGLNALDGRTLEEAYGLGATQLNGNPMTGFTLEEQLAAELAALPTAEELYAMEQMQAQQNYLNSHLSPLMQQSGGEKGGAWGYNEEEDPVWQAYLKQYTRAGEKGMNDVLAQLSARTGGLASSYAGQVAQQTMNDYMQGATDVIPELYDAAYGRYMDEQNMRLAAEETAYQRQQDALDRQTAAEQTAWEREQYQNERAADQQSQGLELLLSMMSLGYQPTSEELSRYGLNQGMADAVYGDYLSGITPKTSGGSTNQSTGAYESTYQQMLNAGINNMSDAVDWLIQAGYDKSDREALTEQFSEILSDEKNNIDRNAEDVPGMEPVRYNQILSDISTKLNAGQMQLALEDVARYWDVLNKSQQSAMTSALKRYGITMQ